MDLGFTREELLDLAAEKAVQQHAGFLGNAIERVIAKRVDKLFAERADALLTETLAKVFEEGLNRQFQRVDDFGDPVGEPTTLKKELARLTDEYWKQRVDKGSGKPCEKAYGSITRAEFLMVQMCAKGLSSELNHITDDVVLALREQLTDAVVKWVEDHVDSKFRVSERPNRRRSKSALREGKK
jgi:hypothetical protein